jgi:hypothetical protein
VLAWHSFFHLAADDQRAMFPVFARHAAPAPFSCSPAARERGSRWANGRRALYHDSLSQEEYRALLAANASRS